MPTKHGDLRTFILEHEWEHEPYNVYALTDRIMILKALSNMPQNEMAEILETLPTQLRVQILTAVTAYIREIK